MITKFFKNLRSWTRKQVQQQHRRQYTILHIEILWVCHRSDSKKRIDNNYNRSLRTLHVNSHSSKSKLSRFHSLVIQNVPSGHSSIQTSNIQKLFIFDNSILITSGSHCKRDQAMPQILSINHSLINYYRTWVLQILITQKQLFVHVYMYVQNSIQTQRNNK